MIKFFKEIFFISSSNSSDDNVFKKEHDIKNDKKITADINHLRIFIIISYIFNETDKFKSLE